jgi:hypothetical protein
MAKTLDLKNIIKCQSITYSKMDVYQKAKDQEFYYSPSKKIIHLSSK